MSYSLLYYGESDKSLLGFLVNKSDESKREDQQVDKEVAAKALQEVHIFLEGLEWEEKDRKRF
jgi:hypothetical protein